MRVTKYEHACLDIEDQGKRLIIDPGVFSTSLRDFSNICAVIVTHQHPDHCDPKLIDTILAENPETFVYTVADTAEKLGDRRTEIITANESALCGTFHVSFFGGTHATIHPDVPSIQNIGVLVNDSVYYPGDSLVMPEDSEVTVLALPTVAPWMKIQEAMDFLRSVKPKIAFPTHNAILSEEGHGIYNGMLEKTAVDSGIEFQYLKSGQSLEA